MRIGNFVPMIACKKGYERNVSGHVQVPIYGMDLLRRAGHEVELISNAFTDDRPAIPHCLPPDMPLHFVPDGRERQKVSAEGVGGHSGGVRPKAFLQQVRRIVAISRNRKFDVLHLHGSVRVAYLARLLSLAGLEIPTVVTTFGTGPRGMVNSILRRTLWPRHTTFVAATNYVADQLRAQGVTASIARHGPVRDLRAEMSTEAGAPPIGERRRVLFWRDPSHANGCDVAVEAFNRLAPKHPDLTFEFAIRPHWDQVPGLEELAARHRNVRIHRFPYPPGVSVASLVCGSLCVFMPIRVVSIDPQLVILESLAAGVPTVASDVRSNSEVVLAGRTGDIVPVGDADASTAAIDRIISDRPRALEMGLAAERDVRERWNWSRFVTDIEAVYRRAVGLPAASPSLAADGTGSSLTPA